MTSKRAMEAFRDNPVSLQAFQKALESYTGGKRRPRQRHDSLFPEDAFKNACLQKSYGSLQGWLRFLAGFLKSFAKLD
jgi:hypothetical protein